MPTDRHEDGTIYWRSVARQWLGRLCFPCLPDRYLEKFIGDYYIDQEPKTFFKQAIRDELTRRHYESSEAEIRSANRASIWGGTAGVRWHEARRRRHEENPQFLDHYLNTRGRMLEQIDWLLDGFPVFRNVCEIGTGNGLMIEYLAGRFARLEHFHAIDLSAEQIANNQAIFAKSRVEYLHVEASEYVRRLCRPGTLFVTCGVFECMTRSEVEELFELAGRSVDPVAFAICDAVDVDFDAEIERESRPRGNLLYSHSYRFLLEKHGYNTCLYELEYSKPIYNRLSMLATSFRCRIVKSHTRTSH
jgi:hypothetical protein